MKVKYSALVYPVLLNVVYVFAILLVIGCGENTSEETSMVPTVRLVSDGWFWGTIDEQTPVISALRQSVRNESYSWQRIPLCSYHFQSDIGVYKDLIIFYQVSTAHADGSPKLRGFVDLQDNVTYTDLLDTGFAIIPKGHVQSARFYSNNYFADKRFSPIRVTIRPAHERKYDLPQRAYYTPHGTYKTILNEHPFQVYSLGNPSSLLLLPYVNDYVQIKQN